MGVFSPVATSTRHSRLSAAERYSIASTARSSADQSTASHVPSFSATRRAPAGAAGSIT